MKTNILLGFVCSALLLSVNAQTTKDYAVRLQATVSQSPKSIVLKWPLDTEGLGYKVFKKNKSVREWGPAIASLPISATSFTDTDIELGKGYEYCVRRNYTKVDRYAFGYIYAAIKKPAETQSRTILLLVDENYNTPLNTEINELMLDMIKDGWIVKRQNISRTALVSDVKNVIKNVHTQSLSQTPLKTVFLLGHIPVPYSGGFVAKQGNIYPPDGHADHGGAWATDMYYGSLKEDEFWTDNIVNNVSPARVQNQNIPGDGKFDAMYIGFDSLILQVGRVDLTNMPAFALNDTLLTKQYLQKLHSYRTAQTPVYKKGLIDDNFGAASGEAFAASAWSDFSTFFGDSIIEADYRIETKKQPYLFTYGCGAGSYTSCSGIITTSQFATDTIQQIFTLLFGSYFGDWDAQNDLLRAPLASKEGGLICAWSGRPRWHLHHMALGETIGYSTLLTQNNYSIISDNPTGYYDNSSSTFVTINLMGDPTLRLHMHEALQQISATPSADSLTTTITWQPDANAIAYYVSKTRSLKDGFTVGTELAANTTSWTDPLPYFGYTKYMVRPIYLEETPSGSYYNLGMGTIDSAYSKNTVGVNEVYDRQPLEATIFPNPNDGNVTIVFSGEATGNIEIFDLQGKPVFNKETVLSNEMLNLSGLDKGYYFAKIKTDDQFTVKKIIIR
jgi:hypothetical protein